MWKEKAINSDLKRKEGLCPLTPEETALVLKALGIDHNVQIYIAAGEIYGGERRMATLVAAFPNLVSRQKQKKPFDKCINIVYSHKNICSKFCGTGQ